MTPIQTDDPKQDKHKKFIQVESNKGDKGVDIRIWYRDWDSIWNPGMEI